MFIFNMRLRQLLCPGEQSYPTSGATDRASLRSKGQTPKSYRTEKGRAYRVSHFGRTNLLSTLNAVNNNFSTIQISRTQQFSSP